MYSTDDRFCTALWKLSRIGVFVMTNSTLHYELSGVRVSVTLDLCNALCAVWHQSVCNTRLCNALWAVWPQSVCYARLCNALWAVRHESRLSSLSHYGLILTYRVKLVCNELISTSKNKNKKSAGGEWMEEHTPKILASEEKAITFLHRGR